MIPGEEWAYDSFGSIKADAIKELRDQSAQRPLTQSETELLFAYIEQQRQFIETLQDDDE